MQIVYRISDTGYSKVKPGYINNENCLKNFCSVFFNHIYDIKILADSCSEDTLKMISKYIDPVNIEKVSVGHGAGTFNLALDLALKNSDEEPVQEGGFMLDKPKKLSIFAPEGSEEAKFKHLSEMKEGSNNYMFWQNLKTIAHAATELLKMDCDKVDDLLSDGHGWALDHIATSADDVEEVYHFVEGRLSDWHFDSEEEMDYSKWSEPMKLVQPVTVSKDLGYHLNNNIALGESIFRYGSEKFKTLLKEVKQLQQKGLIKLNENDQFIVEDYDNGFVVVNENRVKLNTIFEEVETETINEAEFQGKKVELGKPKRGGSKKFYVYVRNPKTGKVKKVSFGAKAGGGNLAVKLKDPKARKAFSDRHNCKSKNDKTKPGYWACRLPRYAKLLGLSGGGTWW